MYFRYRSEADLSEQQAHTPDDVIESIEVDLSLVHMVRHVRSRIHDFDVIQIQGLIWIVCFPDLVMSLGIRFERFSSPFASRDVVSLDFLLL
ncbi:hypothetical protein [Massilia putida]|uniref:hypothetical protein n=1 Tax=Massilia putida TaxID=1141883 RepID=UPI0009514DC6|nr:hypothetical protein [Massilia putida]